MTNSVSENIGYSPFFRVLASHPTGSNYICDPPVTDTDIDYIVFVSDLKSAIDHMTSDGWSLSLDTDENPYGMEFGMGFVWMSLRKGNLNYILTNSKHWYISWVAATRLAKDLNLTDKNDRVQLHRMIKLGVQYEYDGPLPGE